MTPQDRDRYLQWLREVLGREYERNNLGWQDHNKDLDDFLNGFFDEAYESGHRDASDY